MKNRFFSPLKVGVFSLIALAAIFYLTLRVSDLPLSPLGTYSIYLEMKTADNIDHKTPVLVAGIRVGVVDKIELTPQNTAMIRMKIRKGIHLPTDVKAQLKTKGVLGDVFIELVPGSSSEMLTSGGRVGTLAPYADMNELAHNLNEVAVNLKEITGAMKGYFASNDAAVPNILKNMERLTGTLADFSGRNRQNLDEVVFNMKELSQTLRTVVRDNSDEVTQALKRMDSIVQKIDEGRGTVGKLINDTTTGEKINEALDNVNGVVGPIAKLKTEIDYHLEYLGNTGDFKNYVGLNLKPRPDKAFILEFVSDPDPHPNIITTTTDVTSGGVTTSVTTRREEVNSKFRFSAQFAKQLRDFTIRGGLIESSGGVGVDYTRGPLGLKFSAFDFQNDSRDRPHLKGMATVNLAKGFYVLGGVDDFISKRHGPDWFMGAGLRFLDDDIKTLLGAFSLKP